VRSRELSGSPAGQIIGRVHEVRPARDVVFEIVEEWIETNQRIAASTEIG
jgi:NAD(P)H-dependent flavin oxidoreductase YrpB (nitropropane dioxygenase family)